MDGHIISKDTHTQIIVTTAKDASVKAPVLILIPPFCIYLPMYDRGRTPAGLTMDAEQLSLSLSL